MPDGRRVLDSLMWNLRMLRRNPRLIMSLIMGFLICFLLTEKTISLSREFLTDIGIFEPFIWCFADSDSILFASLALLLLLSQIPRLDAPAAYLIFRVNRLNWLLGQALTALVISFGYTLFLLACSAALTAGNAFAANRWSETATLLSFSPVAFEVALSVMRKTVKLTTPYASGQHIPADGALPLLLTAQSRGVMRHGKRADMLAVIALSFMAYLRRPTGS